MGLEAPSAWRIVGRGIVDSSSRTAALTWLTGVPDVPEYDRHQLELALGDTAAAVAFLQERYDAGAADLWRIGTLPQYDPLRGDARFIAIVRNMGLPNGYDRENATAIWP